MISLFAASLKRISNIDNLLEEEKDQPARRELLRKKRRYIKHAHDLCWVFAKQAGFDPDWAKNH